VHRLRLDIVVAHIMLHHLSQILYGSVANLLVTCTVGLETLNSVNQILPT